ncbi:mannose-6-phosphate isomerase [Providencia sp.]|uniref:mannose-6-phosphate isomerase n=1 Tax=Providencia sp. TaxID=589 RepID=UPI000E85F96E|nr:mannose-6-phosphate isomerase [Providencia sp.]MBP6080377.1 mannose-6-phosphate isomerase [Providencia sp.]HBO22052.1 mannose-6-phosphate isomerase [Providencia sp.]
MLKMINKVQHYDWGSKTALTKLYGISNPNNLPMAELWMGAHPKASSDVIVPESNQVISLETLISSDPDKYLGKNIALHYGRLPYLFKVLCAAQPLSVQVHPNKTYAEVGFAKENAAGISLDSPIRNYKDDNHKPELIYALTPFKAMNAFRPLSEIAQLLDFVSAAHPDIQLFVQSPSEEKLARLFAQILNLAGEQKELALGVLKAALNSRQGEPWNSIKQMVSLYPEDNGLFSPLLLNVVELQPGEAMFLYARTPHAYLEGVGLEVMANSDNVLRAGLTNKHIDITELIANIDFKPTKADDLLSIPEKYGNIWKYNIPVEDFSFNIYSINDSGIAVDNNTASILFCIEGELVLSSGNDIINIGSGESIFLPAYEESISIKGNGKLARVFNI